MYKSLSKTCNGNFTLLAKIPSISFTFPNSPSPKLQSRFAPTLPPFAMPSPLPVTFWRCFAFSWKTTGPVVNFDGLPNGSSTLAANSITSLKNERTLAGQWAYSGLALETRISAEYRLVEGQVRRSKKMLCVRGLNKDHNHDLKGLFKGAATMASVRPGPFQDFYQAALAKGIKPTMARLTLARKIAAITLTLWKKGENFDAEKLKSQAA